MSEMRIRAQASPVNHRKKEVSTMRSITKIELQYAHRFLNFKG